MLVEKKILRNSASITPLLTINWGLSPLLNIFIKLESHNLTGSIKDRAAFYIIPYLKDNGIINEHTEIIESSSGNFAISLSCACNYYNLRFTCVIDPKILPINEKLLKLHKNTKIVKVNKCDEYGGYLKARLREIDKILSQNDNCYWVNQYENPLIVDAYKNTLGEEIVESFEQIDYVFISVSSCGTIAGLSQRIKEKFNNAKVIAVDVEGSAISQDNQTNRILSGIGSSIVPKNLNRALIDDFQIVSEIDSIKMCRFILSEYSSLIGGSSGAVLAAIDKYFNQLHIGERKNVLAIFPDSGERYIDTIYDNDWVTKNYGNVLEL